MNMYKFNKAIERYGFTECKLHEFYEPEFEILTPEVEQKILEYIDYYYVKRWGKELKITFSEGLAEMNIPPSKCFILDGVFIRYNQVNDENHNGEIK